MKLVFPRMGGVLVAADDQTLSEGAESDGAALRARLKQIIGDLQRGVSQGRLTRELVVAKTAELQSIRRYDTSTFPELAGTMKFPVHHNNRPANLAEAFIWKLTKWPEYRQFVDYFERAKQGDTSRPAGTDVVFHAFALHLADPGHPIFDQHALRALWAICTTFTVDDHAKCRSALIKKKGKSTGEWKGRVEGHYAEDCRTLFTGHLQRFAASAKGLTLKELDRLLMPLGQAIKASAANYGEFRALCGFPGPDG